MHLWMGVELVAAIAVGVPTCVVTAMKMRGMKRIEDNAKAIRATMTPPPQTSQAALDALIRHSELITEIAVSRAVDSTWAKAITRTRSSRRHAKHPGPGSVSAATTRRLRPNENQPKQ